MTSDAEEATAAPEAEAVAATSESMAASADAADTVILAAAGGTVETADAAPFTPQRSEVDDGEPLPRRAAGSPGLFTPGQWLPSSRREGEGTGDAGESIDLEPVPGEPIAAADVDEGESWGPPTEALLVLDDSSEVPAIRPDAFVDDQQLIDLDREEPDLDEVAARLREWRSSGRSSAWREDDDDQLPGIDDPYLAELREAVRDTAPLGPREHDDRDRDDLDDEHAEGHRFGIFRRRR